MAFDFCLNVQDLPLQLANSKVFPKVPLRCTCLVDLLLNSPDSVPAGVNLCVDLSLPVFAPLDFGDAIFEAPTPLFTYISGPIVNGRACARTIGSLPFNVFVHNSQFIGFGMKLPQLRLALYQFAVQILKDRAALFFQRLNRRGGLSNL